MVFICSFLQQSVVTADGRRWAKIKRLMVYFMDDNFSLCLWGTVFLLSSVSIKPMTTMLVFLRCVCVGVCVYVVCTCVCVCVCVCM